jgi:hypothetical protein
MIVNREQLNLLLTNKVPPPLPTDIPNTPRYVWAVDCCFPRVYDNVNKHFPKEVTHGFFFDIRRTPKPLTAPKQERVKELLPHSDRFYWCSYMCHVYAYNPKREIIEHTFKEAYCVGELHG